MSEPTVSQRDAASTLFNLPGYRVIDAVDIVGGSRRVLVVSTEPPGCPGCGVISTRVHQRTRQRVWDVPVAGAVEVIWCKRRWICAEDLCAKATFAESTIEVPARARSTVRLRHALVAAVVTSGRAVSETARAYGVSWWAVQTALTAALLVLPEVCDTVVTRLGIDEHRYRSVRYFRTPTGGWRRFEPGGTSRSRGRMSTIVDVTTGQVLGVVDGRDSAGVGAWLQERPTSWLDQVEVVAIVPREREVPPPSAAFRKALRTHLPRAAVSVDPFHLVKLANDTLTKVRQRLSHDHKGRRGRLVDPAWANRKLLLRGADTLSEHGWDRLEQVLRTDDPTDELGAAWGIKEQLRRLIKTTTLADAHEAKMLLGHYVQVADMPETDRLWNTICVWWTEIEVLIVTGVTNARTEAANTGIKHLKRTGRGLRNSDNYRARILLSSAARRAARTLRSAPLHVQPRRATKGVLGGLGQTSPASSGRAMLEAMIAGQHDPVELAELARRRLRVKIPELTEALTGRFSEHHAFLARVHLDLNDRHTRTVKELTARVEHVIEPLPPRPRPDHHDPRDQH